MKLDSSSQFILHADEETMVEFVYREETDKLRSDFMMGLLSGLRCILKIG